MVSTRRATAKRNRRACTSPMRRLNNVAALMQATAAQDQRVSSLLTGAFRFTATTSKRWLDKMMRRKTRHFINGEILYSAASFCKRGANFDFL